MLFVSRTKHITPFLFCIAILLVCQACQQRTEGNSVYANWDWYLGDAASTQYSPLDEITPENVHKLKVAWTYNTGDMERYRSWMQCNPLVIDGIVYGTSPKLKLFAVDAVTGEEIWVFDPFEGASKEVYGSGLNRGLSYWKDHKEARIIFSAGSNLYAINARTGKLCSDFGTAGKVDLHTGLGEQSKELFVISNTPGIIFQDLYIVGSRVSETMGAAPGHIRAFNVKSGKLEWIFHTIPQPGEYGYDTWPKDAWKNIGGANCWGGFSLDEKREIIFAPTGSASWDSYGGDRLGDNLFANCVIALNARTGKRIWHFQTVRHDLWDRDLPAPPNLVTIEKDGQKIDAVAQITKSGYVFILNRETGEPLFPIEEVPVIPSDLSGEQAALTQPVPTLPPSFSRNHLAESDLTTRTPEANAYAKRIWRNSLKNSLFIPPSKQGTIVFPGMIGGGEWGGAAIHPEEQIMYVNSNEMPYIVTMHKKVEIRGETMVERGKGNYQQLCSSCHGKNLEGGALFSSPPLVGLKGRLDEMTIARIIQLGKGNMPAFKFLYDNQIEDLTAFLYDPEAKEMEASTPKAIPVSTERVGDPHADDKMPTINQSGEITEDAKWKYPYVSSGYQPFVDQDYLPAIKPPFGTLNAIDLNEGKILWQVPLGDHPILNKVYGSPTGSENYGGPAISAGGLVFIAATMDSKLRAFDQKTGIVLWEGDLPAAGFATPAIYGIDGKQYIVIACGGTRVGTKTGDAYVAFTLQ